MSVRIMLLRTNRTIKKKKISERKNSFDLEHGTYYIQKDKVFLIKGMFGYKPALFYLEGVALPINIDSITLKQKMVKTKQSDGSFKEEIAQVPENIFIDTETIHNLTSTKLLSVLMGSVWNPAMILMIVLIVVNIIISLIGVFK